MLLALLKEERRSAEDFLRLRSFAGNHFCLFVLALAIFVPPAALAMLGLLFLLMLPALGRDPIHFLPQDRLHLLPLEGGERLAFLILARFCNPLAWILGAMGFLLQPRLLYLLPLACLLPWGLERCLSRLQIASRLGLFLKVPGRFGPLYFQTLGSYLRVLDPYLALGLCLWAWSQPMLPGLKMGASLLIVLALSTQAHCLLGIENRQEVTRLRLLSLEGWQLFLVKDLAWLSMLLPLLAFHNLSVGLGAGCWVCGSGHRPRRQSSFCA